MVSLGLRPYVTAEFVERYPVIHSGITNDTLLAFRICRYASSYLRYHQQDFCVSKKPNRGIYGAKK